MTDKDVNKNGGESGVIDRKKELALREEEIMQSFRLTELRSDIAAMTPRVASALKDNYYAAEGALKELLRILETVDAELLEKHDDPSAGYGSYALISEIMLVATAVEHINRSYLGRVL